MNKSINRLKKCTFPCIMTILTFIIGLYFYWASKGDPFLVRLIIISIGYFPTVIFLILTLLSYYKQDNIKLEEFLKVIIVILTAGLFIYYLMAIMTCAFIEADNPVTDISSYRDKVNESRLLKVFPKDIPSGVDNVSFVYSPGALQAGTEIALYYIDKNMTKDSFDKKYKDKAIWIGYKDEYNEKEGLLTGAFSNTPADYNNENDYIIYLVAGECDDSGYCNHGEFLFSAFNEKTNEIIYKSEVW